MPGAFVIWGFCRLRLLLSGAFVVWGFCRLGLLSPGAFVVWGFCRVGLLSCGAFVMWGFCRVGLLSPEHLSLGLLSLGLLSPPLQTQIIKQENLEIFVNYLKKTTLNLFFCLKFVKHMLHSLVRKRCAPIHFRLSFIERCPARIEWCHIGVGYLLYRELFRKIVSNTCYQYSVTD